MTISKAEWDRYISRLKKINDKAVADFRAFVVKGGGYAHMDRRLIIDYAYGLATKYGEASAALTAEMYDAVALLQNVAVPAAIPAETATYSEVAKTINGVIKNTASDEVLTQSIGQMVKMASTDTMLVNAHRDANVTRMRSSKRAYKQRPSGAQVAWVPSGDTCAFCIMLAGNGWRKQTNWGAEQHTEHVHANCDCTYMVRFNDDLDVAGYDPTEYAEMYDNADGGTQEEKLNAMRRDFYAENKEEINEQKRAAYEKRKERESSEAEEFDVG